MTDSEAYFERETTTRLRPTSHVGGGWNPDEQRIAPAVGLIAHAIGRGTFWPRADLDLIAGEETSTTAHVLGLVDVADGIVPRGSAAQVAFPDLDLTAHLDREPVGGGTGFDIIVPFGPHGAGLTCSILHDGCGPSGTVARTLTVRPRTA